ncbi:MAG: type II secretion system F family protein [Planctomycetaceae bacterium]
MTTQAIAILLTCFAVTFVGILLIFRRGDLLKQVFDGRVERYVRAPGERLPEDQFVQFARQTIPRLGRALQPTSEKERAQLSMRLVQAGLFHSQSMLLFLSVKLLLTATPLVLTLSWIGFADSLSKWSGYDTKFVFLAGTVAAVIGFLGPSFWLDKKITQRRKLICRGIPDCIDLSVVCLEAGLSFPVTIQRVSEVFRGVHPELAVELRIVNRRIQMGLNPGKALEEFATRIEVDEIKQLATVIGESEKLGGGLTKPMRVHAATMRSQRMQAAEAQAHKAAVKILIPTVLLIMPCIFLVVMGPAAIRVNETMLK